MSISQADLTDCSSTFANTLSKSDKEFENLQPFADSIDDDEERVYFAFLAAHFHNVQTAIEFYEFLDWSMLLSSDRRQVEAICEAFFQEHRYIGDHRRHIRAAKSTERKIEYVVNDLMAYKILALRSGSQVKLFRLADAPRFQSLLNHLMRESGNWSRLFAFDIIECVSRAFGLYVVPDRFHSELSDTGQGPLKGVSRLLEVATTSMDKRSIPGYEREAIRVIRRELEATASDLVRPSFVFDLESHLCVWQKRK